MSKIRDMYEQLLKTKLQEAIKAKKQDGELSRINGPEDRKYSASNGYGFSDKEMCIFIEMLERQNLNLELGKNFHRYTNLTPYAEEQYDIFIINIDGDYIYIDAECDTLGVGDLRGATEYLITASQGRENPLDYDDEGYDDWTISPLESIDMKYFQDENSVKVNEEPVDAQEQDDTLDTHDEGEHGEDISAEEFSRDVDSLRSENNVLDHTIANLMSRVEAKKKMLEEKQKLAQEISSKRKRREELLEQLKQLEAELDPDKERRTRNEEAKKNAEDMKWYTENWR